MIGIKHLKIINSKEKIFKNQTSSDHAIICIDDKICNNIAHSSRKNIKVT